MLVYINAGNSGTGLIVCNRNTQTTLTQAQSEDFIFFSEEPQLNIYNSVCSCVFVCCWLLIIDLLSMSAQLCIPKDKTRKAVEDNLRYVVMTHWRKNVRQILQMEWSNTSLVGEKKMSWGILFTCRKSDINSEIFNWSSSESASTCRDESKYSTPHKCPHCSTQTAVYSEHTANSAFCLNATLNWTWECEVCAAVKMHQRSNTKEDLFVCHQITNFKV